MYKKYYTDYYNELLGGKKYGDYLVYGVDSDLDESTEYVDLCREIIKHYNVSNFTEESEEQKAKRIAQEKAEKRNNKIDQILGE